MISINSKPEMLTNPFSSIKKCLCAPKFKWRCDAEYTVRTNQRLEVRIHQHIPANIHQG